VASSQEYFDLSEPFFLIADMDYAIPDVMQRVVLLQHPAAVNTFVRLQQPDTRLIVFWVRLIGKALSTSPIWDGKACDFEFIDRVWKDDDVSMLEKAKREAERGKT
jgi:hypothetical protein